LNPASLMNLFPKLPSIPFIGQILGESNIDAALTGISNGISSSVSWVLGLDSSNKDCTLDCPEGWYSWTMMGDSCYKIPDQPIQTDMFWNVVGSCKALDKNATPIVIDGVMEQVTSYALALQNSPKWKELGDKNFLWLGGYATDATWKFLDNTDQISSVMMTMSDLGTNHKNGSCLSADWKTFGDWKARPCLDTNGFTICEMPKKPVCGKKGTWMTLPKTDLNPKTLLPKLFPKSQSIPFLDTLLSGQGQESFFDPYDAQKNNKSKSKVGNSITHVICAKDGTGLQAKVNGKADWDWLYVDGDEVEVTGKWTTFKCGSGSVDAFKIQPSTYISLWTHCHNKGYRVVMPSDHWWSGWYPFQVGKNITDYYKENSGWFGKLTATYSFKQGGPIASC